MTTDNSLRWTVYPLKCRRAKTLNPPGLVQGKLIRLRYTFGPLAALSSRLFGSLSLPIQPLQPDVLASLGSRKRSQLFQLKASKLGSQGPSACTGAHPGIGAHPDGRICRICPVQQKAPGWWGFSVLHSCGGDFGNGRFRCPQSLGHKAARKAAACTKP